MGVSPAPDIAQEIMEGVLASLLEEIKVYLDDIATFSDDWESHLVLLEKLLTLLQGKGFTVNPANCEWGIQETDFLRHWLTPEGVKPWRKKIGTIPHMEPLPMSRNFVLSLEWLCITGMCAQGQGILLGIQTAEGFQ